MTTLRKSALCLPFLLLLTHAFTAGAETVFLMSGQRVEGSVQSLADGVLAITQANGQIRKIPKTEISAIEIQNPPNAAGSAADTPKNFLSALPKTSSKFQTPVQTFQAWKKAAMAGDINGMVECYVPFRQEVVKKELKKLPRDQREQMRKTTVATEFTLAEPVYQGDRAALEVTWRIGIQSDNQVLQFSLEGNDWKIIQ